MRQIVVIIIAALVVCMAAETYCKDAPSDQKQQPLQMQQQQVVPRKVSVDTNYNGKPDRIEYYDEKGLVVKVESDPDEDGIVDETIFYEKGKPVKGSKDVNKDGKPDVWIDF